MSFSIPASSGLRRSLQLPEPVQPGGCKQHSPSAGQRRDERAKPPRSKAGPHAPMNASCGDRSQVAFAASRKKPSASEPHRPKVSTERGTSRPPGRAKAGYRACFPLAAPSAAAPSRSAAPATHAEASGWDTTTSPYTRGSSRGPVKRQSSRACSTSHSPSALVRARVHEGSRTSVAET